MSVSILLEHTLYQRKLSISWCFIFVSFLECLQLDNWNFFVWNYRPRSHSLQKFQGIQCSSSMISASFAIYRFSFCNFLCGSGTRLLLMLRFWPLRFHNLIILKNVVGFVDIFLNSFALRQLEGNVLSIVKKMEISKI